MKRYRTINIQIVVCQYVVFVCLIHGILDTEIHFHVPGSNKEIVKKNTFVEYIDCRTYLWVCDTNIRNIPKRNFD
jgi:hypothetical protein